MGGKGHPFFERLAALENTPQSLAAFDRFIDRPLGLPAPEFFASLYRSLIERLIALLELPAGAGAAQREWRPLYRMGETIDPFYFTESQIAAELEQCPPMSEAQRESLATVLQGYFRLRREGFPAGFPSPLLAESDWRRWSEIFPEQFRWQSMEILQAAGLYTPGSRGGARALARFAEGIFEPEWGGVSLRNWQEACAGGRAGNGPDEGFAHRRDFLAAAFAGEFPSLGIAGVCGDAPGCGDCALADACRWAARPARESMAAAEIMGRLHQGRKEHLSTAQLIRGVLGLEGAAGEALESRLEDISLRRLAGMSRLELKDWLDGAGIVSVRMEGLIELGRRLGEERLKPGVLLRSGRDVFNHYRMRLREVKQEQFLVVLLDSRSRFLAEVMVSQGTLNSSPVHPREVFNHAVRESAAAVMIAHNHPSGDPSPSKDDIRVTMRLKEAGKVIGIPLVDHIIIAGDEYISFVELDLL